MKSKFKMRIFDFHNKVIERVSWLVITLVIRL